MGDETPLAIAEMVAKEAVSAYRAMRRKYRVALAVSVVVIAALAVILWRCAA